MKDQLNILIVDNSSSTTGAFKSIITVTQKIQNPELQFFYALSSPRLVQSLKDRGISAHHIPFLEIQKSWRILLYLPLLLLNSFRLLRIIGRDKIHIVHINDVYNMSGVVVKILRPEIKLVYHVRLLSDSYVRSLYYKWVKIIFSFADKVIAVSNAVGNGLPESPKKSIIYDAVGGVPVSTTVKNERFTFLYVGNFIRGKGQDYALQAFYEGCSEFPQAQLIFVGGDLGKKENKAFLRDLKEDVSKKGFSNSIYFYDYSEDLTPLYTSAHVLLNFSESESFSMVCLESLLSGTPVIASKCGGPEEIIQHEVSGLLVENKNVLVMKEAMVRMYTDKELLKCLTKNSIHVTSQKFSLEQSSNKLQDLYETIHTNRWLPSDLNSD